MFFLLNEAEMARLCRGDSVAPRDVVGKIVEGQKEHWGGVVSGLDANGDQMGTVGCTSVKIPAFGANCILKSGSSRGIVCICVRENINRQHLT